MKDEKIRNRGPKKRDPACLQVQHDIVIPKGTILRHPAGGTGTFECGVAHGNFVVEASVADEQTDTFRKVIAS